MPVPSAQQMRLDFTEFSSTATYPDPLLTFWLTVASKLVNEQRWGDLYGMACELFAAHNIILEARARKDAVGGRVPGLSTGILNSKSVDKVSAGYDTSSSMELDAGHWNLTIYGQRYIRLARLHGAGPLQIGAPGPTVDAGAVSGAWAGPFAPWN